LHIDAIHPACIHSNGEMAGFGGILHIKIQWTCHACNKVFSYMQHLQLVALQSVDVSYAILTANKIATMCLLPSKFTLLSVMQASSAMEWSGANVG
jgi:hypothetical protein